MLDKVEVGKIYRVWDVGDQEYLYMFITKVDKTNGVVTYYYIGSMVGTYRAPYHSCLMLWENFGERNQSRKDI